MAVDKSVQMMCDRLYRCILDENEEKPMAMEWYMPKEVMDALEATATVSYMKEKKDDI